MEHYSVIKGKNRNTGKSPIHYSNWKNPNSKVYILYDYIYIIQQRQNRKDREHFSSWQGFIVGVGGWFGYQGTDNTPDVNNWLIGKDPDAGKDWRQEEKGTTEDEMVEWHHRLDGHEFEQAPGVGDGQGSLGCCNGVTKSWTWLSYWNEHHSAFVKTHNVHLKESIWLYPR